MAFGELAGFPPSDPLLIVVSWGRVRIFGLLAIFNTTGNYLSVRNHCPCTSSAAACVRCLCH